MLLMVMKYIFLKLADSLVEFLHQQLHFDVGSCILLEYIVCEHSSVKSKCEGRQHIFEQEPNET